MSSLKLYIKTLSTLLLLLVSFLSQGQLVAQFNASPLSGCAPVVVNFQDQSTGNPNDWKWYIGTGTTYNLFSVLQNPSSTFFNVGAYNIKLVVKNAAGETNTIIKTQYINVNAAPAPNFTATPLTGCFPLPVTFSNNSIAGSGTITAISWDFGNGSGSTDPSPSHIYTSAGSYNVSLTITNSLGCTKTITKNNYITISTGVNAAFTNSVPTGCSAPETITFTNQSTGIGTLSYLWNFGDGTTSTLQNPTHQYTSTGNFSISLTVTNTAGCTHTTTHPNAVVIGNVNANFTYPTSVCVGQSVTLSNTSAPAPTAAAWNFGNGTSSSSINPTPFSYNSSGTYSIQLTSTFGGCTDVVTHDIIVNPKPVASFVGQPTSSCSAPLTVNYTSTSIGASNFEWHFGDGASSAQPNPTHTYTSVGTYTDTLIVSNASGCIDTIIKIDYIKVKPPVATINNMPQQGCAPIIHTFSASVSTVDPVISYQWFSNGVPFSNAPNPAMTFQVGIYDIKLVVTTAGGCTDTVIVIGGIKASLKPTAAFTANPTTVCAFNPVNFTDQSTGTITQWQWLFGDATSSSQQNPLHPYEDTGHFAVTLIVGNNGCFDTLRIPDYITVTPPIAAFTIVANCNNHFLRTFTDASIGADTYAWTFGDGGTSSIPSPSHIYTTPGIYIVNLTVHNNVTGCDHTSSKQVTIADEYANFSASILQLCKNANTTFTATSPNTPSGIASYEWSFGDGTVSYLNPVNHTYFDAGSYTIRLIITDINGCKDTLIKPNYIKVFGPSPNFTVSTPGSCLLSNITFNDQSLSDGIHPITQWTWDFGDNTIQNYTAAPFTHTYSAPGIFNVKLTVTDNYGCAISITKPSFLTISQPVAQFSTPNSPSCPNAPVTFVNLSTGPGLSYLWNFGDGTNPANANTATPTHFYTTEGTYTVKLTVTDMYGCTAHEIKVAYIDIHSPVANFTSDGIFSTCPPLNSQFTNTSTYCTTYLWDFGDGSTSTNINPSHTFNAPGIFTVKLTGTSFGGCTSVKTQQIEVRGPLGSFSYSPINGCNPLNVNFVGHSEGNVQFIWDYNDGIVTAPSLSDSFPQHTYSVQGFYIPKMILKDAGGCTIPILGADTIKVNGVTPSFDADTLLRCTAGVVTFTNSSISNELITGYQWDFGDGSALNTDISPSHLYTSPGIYFPKLKATTQSGCSNIYTAPIPVKVVKTPKISITQSANKCVPASMSFNGNLLNGDTSAINWHWSFVNGNNVPITANGQFVNGIIFINAGAFSDTLYATNSSGCRDTSFTNLEVYPKPIVSAGSDITICKGTGKPLNATGAVTYSWSPSTGLSCTNCSSPIANPTVVNNYVVTGTSTLGCINTASVKVSVMNPFKMPLGSNASLCVGKSKVLTASGASSYVWSPAAGLNTTSGNVVTAAPTNTTNYMVIGKDSMNCFSDTAYYFVKVYPIPTVSAGADQTINIGKTATLTPIISADVNSVLWTPSTAIVNNNYPSITVKPNVDMQYKVSVSNQGGCMAEALVNIFVICDGANVYIPNTFSPNGDGVNEVFYPRGTGLFSIKQLRIFNRWGEQVFEKYSFKANDEAAGWDGSFKGQKLLPDVYIYIMDVLCNNNQVLTLKGNIALIK